MDQQLKDALAIAENGWKTMSNQEHNQTIERLTGGSYLPASHRASAILAAAYREEHDKRRSAELETALILQDLDTVRAIILKGGDASAVLKFLDTETTRGHQ